MNLMQQFNSGHVLVPLFSIGNSNTVDLVTKLNMHPNGKEFY